MNICTIIGVRPQFIKAAVLSPMIRKEHKEILIHTGQHYDANMSDVFFRELGLPKPNYTLMPVGGTAQEQIDSMVRQLIPIIQREKADAVLIYGDTNSTLAGALAAEEAHYARTPYVFVLDIPKPPSDTRFDSSRLVRPKRDEILEKLRQPQQFVEKAKYEAVDLHEFENNLLEILRNFEQLLRTGH